ncbi:hypothetical protein CYMTET_49892 [Cymbomonas tetramitiformis]|uniref:Uncharacterized protein n=1 Tax=Cymbomonas tetramitiformis TaxID=36881 RepID=A0AAE0BQG8_9CHLO|nr:hypothetical protein CYMTET_49892 [Cymbomonas tetramitiformis]
METSDDDGLRSEREVDGDYVVSRSRNNMEERQFGVTRPSKDNAGASGFYNGAVCRSMTAATAVTTAPARSISAAPRRLLSERQGEVQSVRNKLVDAILASNEHLFVHRPFISNTPVGPDHTIKEEQEEEEEEEEEEGDTRVARSQTAGARFYAVERTPTPTTPALQHQRSLGGRGLRAVIADRPVEVAVPIGELHVRIAGGRNFDFDESYFMVQLANRMQWTIDIHGRPLPDLKRRPHCFRVSEEIWEHATTWGHGLGPTAGDASLPASNRYLMVEAHRLADDALMGKVVIPLSDITSVLHPARDEWHSFVRGGAHGVHGEVRVVTWWEEDMLNNALHPGSLAPPQCAYIAKTLQLVVGWDDQHLEEVFEAIQTSLTQDELRKRLQSSSCIAVQILADPAVLSFLGKFCREEEVEVEVRDLDRGRIVRVASSTGRQIGSAETWFEVHSPTEDSFCANGFRIPSQACRVWAHNESHTKAVGRAVADEVQELLLATEVPLNVARDQGCKLAWHGLGGLPSALKLQEWMAEDS